MSERAVELARLRFDEGVTDFLQVLDAERTMLEAQDALAQGRTNAVNAFVELYRALCGIWPLDEGWSRERGDDSDPGFLLVASRLATDRER